MAFILGVHFLREKKKKDDSLQLNFFSGPVDFNKVFFLTGSSKWNRFLAGTEERMLLCRKYKLSKTQFTKLDL